MYRRFLDCDRQKKLRGQLRKETVVEDETPYEDVECVPTSTTDVNLYERPEQSGQYGR